MVNSQYTLTYGNLASEIILFKPPDKCNCQWFLVVFAFFIEDEIDFICSLQMSQANCLLAVFIVAKK